MTTLSKARQNALYADVVVNAKDYDAVGDDTADDAVALQESIDAVPENGTWILPVGNYRTSATLNFRTNATYIFHGKIKPHGSFDDYLLNFGKGTTTESPGPEGPGNRLVRMDVQGVWLDCEDQSRGIRTHRIDNSTFRQCRVDNVCGSALRCTVTRESAFHDFFAWYGAPIATLTAASRNTEALIDLEDELNIPAGYGDPNNKIDFYNLTASYCGATTYLNIDTTSGVAYVRDIRFFGGQVHYLDDFDVSNTVDYPRYGDSVSRSNDAAVVLIDVEASQRVAFYGTLVNYPGKEGVAIRVGTASTKLAQYPTFRDLFINNAYSGGTAIGFQIRYATDVDVAGCMPLLWNGTGTETTFIANFWQDATGYARQNVFGQLQLRRNTNGTGLYLDGANSVGTLSPYLYSVSPDKRDWTMRRASGAYHDDVTQYLASSTTTAPLTITNCANNGSGLIRVTSASHGLPTGKRVTITGVVGTTEANATWNITRIDANNFDLVGSTFSNAYSSGGSIYFPTNNRGTLRQTVYDSTAGGIAGVTPETGATAGDPTQAIIKWENASYDGGIALGGSNRRARYVSLAPLNAAPAEVFAGMICLADRTNWDPAAKGAGNPYVVLYIGGAWTALH